ncbi:MAG: metal ABC transporter permease [Pirellulales bacterium]|nr:metal ABC transporter permease [Pirellulales bacterium]
MIAYNSMVVLAGSALLGAGAGVVGSFAVLRRRALTGDALSHATLPGLCLAFLVLGERSLPAMLVGALCTGVLGVAVISALRRWTRIKEDAAIGIVLGVFFGGGIALSGYIQKSSIGGSKAGLDSYIFGKTAGMIASDVYLIAAMAAVCAILILLLYKEFKLMAFDAGFAKAQGWPVWRLDLLLMSLMAVAVVIGLPAVGAILMAALLILPAAAARFWTDRLDIMLVLSAIFGSTMGLFGTAISVQMAGIPTGPIIVVAGAMIFLISMLFAPRRGALARGIRQLQFRRLLAAGGYRATEGAETTLSLALPLEDIGGPMKLKLGFGNAISDHPDDFQWRRPMPTTLQKSWLYLAIQFGGVAIGAVLLFAAWWRLVPPTDRPLAGWTILIGCLVNIPCAILGCYLVLRRMSLLGDAISHAVLPGIVLGFMLTGQITGWPILAGAMVFGFMTAFLTHALKDLGRVPEDSSMGIVYTTLFSIGVILISRYAAGTDLDAQCVLYGMLDTVAVDVINIGSYEVPRTLPTMLGMCASVILFIGILWKELKIASFDAGLSTAMGIHAAVIHYLLMAVVAGVTVTAFEAIGSILVVAMLIVPAATAQLLADRLGPMIGCAVAVAIVSAILGDIGAQVFNTNVAAMMAVAVGLQFLLAVFIAPQHGLVSKWWRNFLLSLRITSEDMVAALYRTEELLARGESLANTAIKNRSAVTGLAHLLAVPYLRRRGEIQLATDGRWQLTDAGREVGRSLVRSHRLWEAYLEEQAELPLDHLHAPAERMEHFIGHQVQQQLAAEVSVVVDPHGREIPSEK